MKITNWAEFQKAVVDGISSQGTNIIEVPGSRDKNVLLHERVLKAAADSLTVDIKE